MTLVSEVTYEDDEDDANTGIANHDIVVITLHCWHALVSIFSCPESVSHSTSTFDIQRGTSETFDRWNIWSEWWEDMTWPKKIYLPTYLPTYVPPLENTQKERS